jgi:hypothetical protein
MVTMDVLDRCGGGEERTEEERWWDESKGTTKLG